MDSANAPRRVTYVVSNELVKVRVRRAISGEITELSDEGSVTPALQQESLGHRSFACKIIWPPEHEQI